MSLLIKESPEKPTKEIQLANAANRIKEMSRSSYRNLTDIQKTGINALWHNPLHTPQEIIDVLGADALKIFQYHGALTEYLVTLAQLEGITPDIKLPPNAFIVDPQTGTITVTEDPYTP